MATANDLILGAFNLLEIFNDQQPVLPNQTQKGLATLNDLITSSPTSELIPYNDTIIFNLTAGKKTYEISLNPSADFNSNKLITLNFANILLGGVQYPLEVFNRYQYFNKLRAVNVESLPYAILQQNQVDKTLLTFYPVPGDNYIFELIGKFLLGPFTLNQTITNMPQESYLYLKYALAHLLKDSYRASIWSDAKQKTYDELTRNLKGGADHDYTVNLNQGGLPTWLSIYSGIPY